MTPLLTRRHSFNVLALAWAPDGGQIAAAGHGHVQVLLSVPPEKAVDRVFDHLLKDQTAHGPRIHYSFDNSCRVWLVVSWQPEIAHRLVLPSAFCYPTFYFFDSEESMNTSRTEAS